MNEGFFPISANYKSLLVCLLAVELFIWGLLKGINNAQKVRGFLDAAVRMIWPERPEPLPNTERTG